VHLRLEAGTHGSVSGIAAALVFLGFLATVAWRWTEVRAVGDGRELLVRNLLLTYHIPREAIGGFRSGAPWRLKHRSFIMTQVVVDVVLKDGRTVALLATLSYVHSLTSSAFPERHQKDLVQLEEWLRPDQRATPTGMA
jgi:hypothetical protein